ncbi:MAG: hypothetical protein Q4F05_09045 [bacterium]|nr:hypothetical protein [bacterium]
MRQDLYTEIFSQIHSSAEVNEEEFEMRSKKYKSNKRAVKKVAVLAASLTIVLGVSATAYATNMFGLNKLVIKTEINATTSPDTDTAKKPESTEKKQQDRISLQGWEDSPEAKALTEWQTFINNYDQDGKILDQVGDAPTKFDKKYGMYSIYSQEMADKLETIIKKYDLKLHKSITDFADNKDLVKLLGIDFVGEMNSVEGGYMYEDGGFHYDGVYNLGDDESLDYQFSNCKKGTFNDVTLTIGDAKEYKQWSYKTKDGTEVLLALGSMKSLIITERDQSFVSINVLAGTDEGFIDNETKSSEEVLEKLADSFQYSLLK